MTSYGNLGIIEICIIPIIFVYVFFFSNYQLLTLGNCV